MTPTSLYASSAMSDANPAPLSILTSNPNLMIFSAESGVAATRFSPSWTSLGIPIFIHSPALVEACGSI